MNAPIEIRSPMFAPGRRCVYRTGQLGRILTTGARGPWSVVSQLEEEPFQTFSVHTADGMRDPNGRDDPFDIIATIEDVADESTVIPINRDPERAKAVHVGRAESDTNVVPLRPGDGPLPDDAMPDFLEFLDFLANEGRASRFEGAAFVGVDAHGVPSTYQWITGTSSALEILGALGLLKRSIEDRMYCGTAAEPSGPAA